MHIMDILQNSTRAKANNITLEVIEDYDADTLTLVFKDDGCGMSAETVEKDGSTQIDYLLDTDEVYEALDGVSLQEPDVMAYLKEMVEENIR